MISMVLPYLKKVGYLCLRSTCMLILIFRLTVTTSTHLIPWTLVVFSQLMWSRPSLNWGMWFLRDSVYQRGRETNAGTSTGEYYIYSSHQAQGGGALLWGQNSGFWTACAQLLNNSAFGIWNTQKVKVALFKITKHRLI